MSVRRDILALLQIHQMEYFDNGDSTCRCEPGYLQGPMHIVDAIMSVLANRLGIGEE